MEHIDVIQRSVAKGNIYENGVMRMEIQRDRDFKAVQIVIEGELALTITSDSSGHGFIEYHEGATHTLQGRL